MQHKEDCSRGLAATAAAIRDVIEKSHAEEVAAFDSIVHDFSIIEAISRVDDDAASQLAIIRSALAADPSESTVIEQGKDGAPWRFFGSKSGDMMEIVKLRPDGSVAIAPHATMDDLRGAIEVLGHALHEAQRIPGVEPADIAIDVVIH